MVWAEQGPEQTSMGTIQIFMGGVNLTTGA